jgi:hypothetical protein
MLEKIINQKKEQCAEIIRKNHPKFVDEKGEINSYGMEVGPEFYSTVPDECKEFFIWHALSKELYWRAIGYIKELSKPEKSRFSEEDKKNLTNIIAEQIMKGSNIAAINPAYSDIWKLLEDKENPLKSYVTEEHRQKAVNEGFWASLENTSKNPDYAGRELTKILSYDYFFKYFDFESGAEKAKSLSLVPDLSHVDLNKYLRWYIVQELRISDPDEKKEAETLGKLSAPLIYEILSVNDFNEDYKPLKRLATFFIQGELIRSNAMQEALGKVFESELERGLLDEDSFSSKNLEIVEKALIDKESHVSKVLAKIKDKLDYSDLKQFDESVAKYLPAKDLEANINSLRHGLESMAKFDVNLFKRWLGLNPKKDISKALYGTVRNKALSIYMNQKQRPSGDIVKNLSGLYSSDALNGYFFCDFIIRKRWFEANKIFMSYDNYGNYPSHERDFKKGVESYVIKHGKIPLVKEGLSPSACYPSYNKIIRFYDIYKDLFIVKEK